MDLKNNFTLPHLENVFSLSNDNYINTYSLALEGWRRGLNLNFHLSSNNKINYSLSNNNNTHYFYSSKETRSKINKNRENAKQLLVKKNIPTPKGKFFEPGISHHELVSYAMEIGFPIVLKINNTSKKPYLNIQNSKELEKTLSKYKKRFASHKLTIEKFVEGNELHFFIIENQIISIVQKKLISIIGNGKDSIHKLINNINKEREENTYLNNKLIKVKKTKTKIKKKFASHKLMIKKIVKGNEHHFFIIEYQIISIVQKKLISIIGNGKDTNHKLINYLNKEREENTYLNNKLIKVNKRLKNILSNQNYTINSIPMHNEQVYLQKISDLSNKGDSVNITNQVTTFLKNIAIQAGNTNSSTPYYEVKMIADLKENTGTVLSVNTKP